MTHTEISLSIADNASRWQDSKKLAEQVLPFAKAVLNGEKPYVQFPSTHSRRPGAIGRVVGFDSEYGNQTSDLLETEKNLINPANTSRYSYRSSYRSNWNILVEFDDKKTKPIKVDSRFDNMTWLKDYTGPTKYVFLKGTSKTKPVLTPVYDQLDRELEVGDVVVYTAMTGRYGKRTIVVGNITKINPPSTVYVKNMRMKEDDAVKERRVGNPSEMLKLTKDLMNQLMLKKLSVL